MFEGFRQFLADQRAAGAQVRLLTQNDVGGGPDRVGAYLRNEAMTNEVYRPYGCPWACLYDRRARTAETLRQVRQVHPRLLEPNGAAIPSTTYVTPADFVARGAPPAPVPPVVELNVELTGVGELVRLRRLLGRWAGGHGDGGGRRGRRGRRHDRGGGGRHQRPAAQCTTGPGPGVSRRWSGPGTGPQPRLGGGVRDRRLPRPQHRKWWRHRTLACPSTRRRRHHPRRHSGDDRRAELSHDGPAVVGVSAGSAAGADDARGLPRP